ncbi:nucleotide-diphosphate-sugar epimerase [Planobispora rosea]|uniref:Nucleotide-diphosphate-sugar epimerase n=1 Tax=Planobispora rosea TaxID=35762 RepID=A0A8J3WDH4_PLARO|nr:SDR family oxidoreductase [Planobispora rosea]GGS67322.1 nucleotide-diphosphate-sugar epimerase [Planobispora rosea]GIH85143.1 nucleotide-diphosphate-sugar epimerase [Planobispora rosea]
MTENTTAEGGTADILVTGGTGVLGRPVVDRLTGAGRTVRVLSRTRKPCIGDLSTGAGLAEALDGVRTIVHLASDPRTRGADVAAARRLIAAAPEGAHLVYISIVGVDRHPYSYYRAKYEVERMIERSGLPYTILRAVQFHDLVLYGMRMLARLPIVFVPAGVAFQPVAAEEVAARLAGLALGEPAGRVPDMGGPEILSAAELARLYLRSAGKRRPVLPVPIPGGVIGAYRRGVHLAPEHRDGRITFEEFLTTAAGRPGYAGAGR